MVSRGLNVGEFHVRLIICGEPWPAMLVCYDDELACGQAPGKDGKKLASTKQKNEKVIRDKGQGSL